MRFKLPRFARFAGAMSCAILGLPALAHAQTPSLDATERSITSAVDHHNADAIALLQKIVDINSGTMNFAGVRRVADVLRPQFEALGFTTRWVEGAPFHRAGHLIAEHRGTGRKILLVGHLDTVFEPNSPFQKFEWLPDSMARGPGVIDMKGGDIIILYALRALKDAGALDRMNVAVVLDGDEEEAGTPTSLARQPLVDEAKGAAFALGFEDGSGDPHTAVASRRGAGSWTLTTTGQTAHSSQIFTKEYGAGAVYEASRILDAFYKQLAGEPYLTFNPGLAAGGTIVKVDTTVTEGSVSGKRNVVADSMIVAGDLRTLSPEQFARAKRMMEDVVTHHLPKTTATITFDDGYPPMAPTEGNKRLLATYDRVSRDLGTGAVVAVDPAKAGAADVSFIAHIVPQVIDALGLPGHDDHSEKETGDIKWLSPKTKRAALLMYRLTVRPDHA